MFDEQRLGNDGTEASRPYKPDDGDNQMKEKMTTSRIQAWYQNRKKHLILPQFSNSPWTPSQNGANLKYSGIEGFCQILFALPISSGC